MSDDKQHILIEKAESMIDLIESDFGQSGKDVRIEMIRCEFDKYEQQLVALREVIEEILKAPGLGGSHPQFSRYFFISEELGKRASAIIGVYE